MKKIKKFKELSCPPFSYQDNWYASYDAASPRTLGHKIFVPKENNVSCIAFAFSAAYSLGNMQVQLGRWAGYKLLVEYGKGSQSEVDWPEVHLFPIAKEPDLKI